MTIKYTERFNKLWFIFDNALAHGKKGSKFTALKAFEKYSEEEQDRIIFDTQALMRYFKTQPKPDRLPHLSTWLNQRYFEQEIPSIAENKKEIILDSCCVEGCDDEVHGSAYKYCAKHIPCQHDDRLRESWRKTGINSKDSDYIEQCRQYCKDNFGGLFR